MSAKIVALITFNNPSKGSKDVFRGSGERIADCIVNGSIRMTGLADAFLSAARSASYHVLDVS